MLRYYNLMKIIKKREEKSRLFNEFSLEKWSKRPRLRNSCLSKKEKYARERYFEYLAHSIFLCRAIIAISESGFNSLLHLQQDRRSVNFFEISKLVPGPPLSPGKFQAARYPFTFLQRRALDYSVRIGINP